MIERATARVLLVDRGRWGARLGRTAVVRELAYLTYAVFVWAFIGAGLLVIAASVVAAFDDWRGGLTVVAFGGLFIGVTALILATTRRSYVMGARCLPSGLLVVGAVHEHRVSWDEIEAVELRKIPSVRGALAIPQVRTATEEIAVWDGRLFSLLRSRAETQRGLLTEAVASARARPSTRSEPPSG